MSFTDTNSYPPAGSRPQTITDMSFLRINYVKLTDTDTDLKSIRIN